MIRLHTWLPWRSAYCGRGWWALMISRGWWVMALTIALLTGPGPALRTAAAGDETACAPALASAAVADAIARGATVECDTAGALIITYPAQPVVPPPGMEVTLPQARPRPADFDGWVFLFINGQPLRTPAGGERTEPDAYIVASTGRTVMPIRFFTEAIGGLVDWHEPQRKVTLAYRGRQVELWIDRREARVDGRSVPLDQPPFIYMGRTMLPTRFLMEAFGAQVAWDPANSAVWVELPGARCVNPTYCGQLVTGGVGT